MWSRRLAVYTEVNGSPVEGDGSGSGVISVWRDRPGSCGKVQVICGECWPGSSTRGEKNCNKKQIRVRGTPGNPDGLAEVGCVTFAC